MTTADIKNDELYQVLSNTIDQSKVMVEASYVFKEDAYLEITADSLGLLMRNYLTAGQTQYFTLLKNTLLLINEILPRLPNDLEEFQLVYSGFASPISVDDKESIEKFVNKITVEIFKLFHRELKEISVSSYFLSVFLKVLHFAPLGSLTNQMDRKFVQIINRFLEPTCDTLNRVAAKAVIIVGRRVPGFCRQHLLTVNNMFQLRRLGENSILFQRFSEEAGLENMIRQSVSNLNLLEDVYRCLVQGDLTTVVESLSKLPPQQLSIDVLFSSNVLKRFVQSNIKSCKVGCEEDVRRCLVNVLRVSKCSSGEYQCDVGLFDALITFVKATLDRASTKWLSHQFHDDNDCVSCKKCPNYYLALSDTMAMLLQYLYVLNETWYQWFDMFTAPPLVDKNKFTSDPNIVSDDGFSTKQVTLFDRLVRFCPAIFSCQFKKKAFSKIYSEKTLDLILFRENTLERFIETSKNWTPLHFHAKWFSRFNDESGLGNGVTKEFFTTVSKIFHGQDLWARKPVTKDNPDLNQYCDANGLFPKLSTSNSGGKFYSLGQLMAKAYIGDYIVALPLSIEFFKWSFPSLFSNVGKSYYDAVRVFPSLAKLVEGLLAIKRAKAEIIADTSLTENEKHNLIINLKFGNECTFQDLCIFFTIPETGEELIEGGSNVPLTPFNVEDYLNCLGRAIDTRSAYIEEFKKGFASVIPISDVVFLPEELQTILCGQESEQWTVEYLKSSFKFEDNFANKYKHIDFFFSILASFNAQERRMFTEFVTGMSRLPTGGFQNLHPPLTIANSGCWIDKLPTASTCSNILRLPLYSSLEIMRQKILLAISEGAGSFHIA